MRLVRSQARERPRHRVWRVRYLVAAAVLPVVVALLFGHPAHQVLVPESITLSVAVVLTVLDDVAAGLIAVLSSTISLWFFNFPPGYSFNSENNADIIAAVVSGVIGCGMVLLITSIRAAQREALYQQTRLAADLTAQREATETLQRAILPETTPAVAGVSCGWSYTPGAGSATQVGGDWYAFVPVARRGLGVAVGDVAGHGLAAVRTMAEYRYALRTLATQGGDPAVVLAELDDTSHLYRIVTLSTCVYGLLDPAASTWTYTSAGHLPPLLTRAGHVRTLDAPHGPPLGTHLRQAPYRQDVIGLKRGDVLALYTDGLVERRDESIDQSLGRLVDRLGGVDTAGDLTALSTEIVADLIGSAPEDDAALVLIRLDS